MPLEATLADIVSRLRQGLFPNEQAISQGIVLRVLQDLGWNAWDIATVWPEFQTGEGRADFALCHPPSKPAIFIEVKQPGRAEDAVRQALEYAFHTGVPFVVLTDGKTWSFYLPAEQGSYEDRRVYKLDLFERPAAEAAAVIERYLSHQRVESGDALSSARQEYRSRNRAGLARQTIPAAWAELAAGGESLLVELVQNAVESKCGVRPEDTDVLDFLQRPFAGPSLPTPNTSAQISPRQPSPGYPSTADVPRRRPARPRAGTIKFLGQDISVRNALEATLYILRQLQARDPSFLQRCAAHPNNFGTTRAYIAKTPEELFPNRPDLRPKHETIADGWLLNTNLNNGLKARVVRFSCDVAGLRFGQDIQIDFK